MGILRAESELLTIINLAKPQYRKGQTRNSFGALNQFYSTKLLKLKIAADIQKEDAHFNLKHRNRLAHYI